MRRSALVAIATLLASLLPACRSDEVRRPMPETSLTAEEEPLDYDGAVVREEETSDDDEPEPDAGSHGRHD